MATMILEVSYRHLPISGNQGVQGFFGDSASAGVGLVASSGLSRGVP